LERARPRACVGEPWKEKVVPGGSFASLEREFYGDHRPNRSPFVEWSNP
jgi:hypothetical protein